MGRKSQRLLFIVCSALLLLALFDPQTASAHRMIIEHSEKGIIQVRYDDGTSAGVAQVTAYDADGEILFEREADDNGTLEYEEELAVQQITADDGMGHRATWTKEDKASILEDIPLFVRAIFGVSILVFLAAIFFLRSDKKSKDGEKSE